MALHSLYETYPGFILKVCLALQERKASFAELSVLPSGDLPGFNNQHLSYVNKLRMCWHKCQSALVVDDQIDKVIFFFSKYSNFVM